MGGKLNERAVDPQLLWREWGSRGDDRRGHRGGERARQSDNGFGEMLGKRETERHGEGEHRLRLR